MSRILNPSPGEIADRQTILHLKIQHGSIKEIQSGAGARPNLPGAAEKALSAAKIQHFVDENEQLQKYLEANWFPKVPASIRTSYEELFNQLAAINAHLWNREDEARTLRSEGKNTAVIHRAGELLFEITQLNDQRAELVQEINELFGVRVQEKVYT